MVVDIEMFCLLTGVFDIVFEDKEYSDRSVAAVEKQIHYGAEDPSRDLGTIQLEDQQVQRKDLV